MLRPHRDERERMATQDHSRGSSHSVKRAVWHKGTREEVAVTAQKGSDAGSRLVLLSSSMVLALVLLWGAYSGSAHIAAQTSPKPNFVFILADDMRYDDLKYMPKTSRVLVSGGMTFSK